MSEKFNAAEQSLSYDPEPLGFDKNQIMREAYDHLCEMADNKEIEADQVDVLYAEWRNDWGLE